jgi:hypothetical protein
LTLVERYRQPSDVPAEIAVFPLRGAILLPRASMPLNIFEPRYLEMIEDAIRGSRVIGIIQPVADADNAPSPLGKGAQLRRIGCAARLTAFQETEDRRILVSLTGIARFLLVREIETPRPYRVCAVSCEGFAGDFVRGNGEGEIDRGELLSVLKAYLEAKGLKADWQAINRSSNEFLVNTLSVICPYGQEEKQALLEAADLKSRAKVLMTLAQMELASTDGGSSSTMQ